MEIFTESIFKNFTVDHRLLHKYAALIGAILLRVYNFRQICLRSYSKLL